MTAWNSRLTAVALLALVVSAAACDRDGKCEVNEDCGSCSQDCGRCAGIPAPPTCNEHAYPRFDGKCNNLQQPLWGAIGSSMQHMTPPRYSDNIAAPINTISARDISNKVCNSVTFITSHRHLSPFVTFFGQMINHDCHATDTNAQFGKMTAPTPEVDVWFQGHASSAIDRTVVTPGTGANGKPRRGQVRTVTSYLDGSAVYGNTEECGEALRTHSDGLMKAVRHTGGIFPPTNEEIGKEKCEMESPRKVPIPAFGDFRANENPGLFTMHTLFFRNHNFWARRLKSRRLFTQDEQLFQAARAYNRGELQNIAAYEWFPAITGRQLPPYDGYDPKVNPAPFPEILASAFRFGHTMVQPIFNRYSDESAQTPCCGGPILLHEAFFVVDNLMGPRCTGTCTRDKQVGLDNIISGLTRDPAGEIDPFVVDPLRNMLFPFMERPMDLVTLNILRNRDLGVGTLNQVREGLGLEPHASFTSISASKQMQWGLAQAYNTVDDVELFVGGLSEDHLPGGSMGETFVTLLTRFFVNLRKADRFWFERPGSLDPVECRDVAMRQYIYKTTLWDVIRRNSGVQIKSRDAFFQYGMPSSQPAHPMLR